MPGSVVTRHLAPDAVPFDFRVAYKFLKMPPSSPNAEVIHEMVARGIDQCRAVLEPRYRYRVCTMAGVEPGAVCVCLEDGVCFEGPGLGKVLEKARYAAFFVLTLGDKLDAEIARRAQDDFTTSYILDGVASTFAQGVLEVAEYELAEAAQTLGCALTHRFAPGYHNWDLRQQKQLFALLKAHEIGVKLSESCFMLPQKSLSGVYGFEGGREE